MPGNCEVPRAARHVSLEQAWAGAKWVCFAVFFAGSYLVPISANHYYTDFYMVTPARHAIWTGPPINSRWGNNGIGFKRIYRCTARQECQSLFNCLLPANTLRFRNFLLLRRFLLINGSAVLRVSLITPPRYDNFFRQAGEIFRLPMPGS